MTDTLRIYVADLAEYNAGRLKGDWIDVTGMADVSEIWEQIEARGILGRNEFNPSEWNEYAIHDHEGFGGLIGEYSGFDAVIDIAKRQAETGDNWAAYLAYCDNSGGICDVEDFEDAFCGEWGTEREYAEELFDDIVAFNAPDFLLQYFDYAKWTRDLFMTDYFSADNPGGGLFVFRNV